MVRKTLPKINEGTKPNIQRKPRKPCTFCETRGAQRYHLDSECFFNPASLNYKQFDKNKSGTDNKNKNIKIAHNTELEDTLNTEVTQKN